MLFFQTELSGQVSQKVRNLRKKYRRLEAYGPGNVKNISF